MRRSSIADSIWGIALILLIVGAGVAFVAGLCAVVYFWWHGVLVGMEHFGVPMLAGFFIMIIVLAVGRGLGALLLACLGAWASIALLNIWWFWVLCLYATTFAALFVAFLLAVGASLLALVFKIIEEISLRR